MAEYRLAMRESGVSMSPVSYSNHKRERRGEVKGWTVGASRRNAQWLQSVAVDELDVTNSFAVTLTLPADTGITAKQFGAARTSYVKVLRRAGLERLHWVVEWTRRKTPHIHMFVTMKKELDSVALVLPWLRLTSEYGTRIGSQSVERVWNALGWLKYAAKHSARGVGHYQRQGAPDGWEKTGRLWGKSGQWPMSDSIVAPDLPREVYYQLRRDLLALSVSQARPQSRGRMRRTYKHVRRVSSVKAFTDWHNMDVVGRLVWYRLSQWLEGHEETQIQVDDFFEIQENKK